MTDRPAVAALRAALENVADFVYPDGSRCWCNAHELVAHASTYDPAGHHIYCIEARDALGAVLEAPPAPTLERFADLIRERRDKLGFSDSRDAAAWFAERGVVVRGEAGPPPPESDDDAKVYPCDKCGTLFSKREGGTTFTICESCWETGGLSGAVRGLPPAPQEPSAVIRLAEEKVGVRSDVSLHDYGGEGYADGVHRADCRWCVLRASAAVPAPTAPSEPSEVAKLRAALLHVADEITGQLNSGTLKDAPFQSRVYWAQVAGVAREA